MGVGVQVPPPTRSDQGKHPGRSSFSELARGPFVALDMALRHDTVAVLWGRWRDGRLVVRHRLWEPAGDMVDVSGVEAHLRDLHRRYRVVEVAYDPAYFQRSAEVLGDDGLVMVEFPQSAARMVPACQTAYSMVNARTIAHDGAPGVAEQVNAAAPRQAGEGWRLSKGKAKRKIDAAIAVAMLCDRATARREPERKIADPFVIFA